MMVYGMASNTTINVPREADAPSIQTHSPTSVGGFRGMAEGGTIGAPAAIANALADALTLLGADVFELPMTDCRSDPLRCC